MSLEPKPKLSLNADLKVNPELSQTSIVLLLLLSGGSAATSFFFSWHEKPLWLPVTFCVVFLLLAGVAWFRSQRAIDMGNSAPTQIETNDEGGLKLVTDTRAIYSDNSITNIAKLIETIGLRQPLPDADGIVDKDGGVVKGSSEDGKKATDKINRNLKKASENFQKSFFEEQIVEQASLDEYPMDNNYALHSGFVDKDAGQ